MLRVRNSRADSKSPFKIAIKPLFAWLNASHDKEIPCVRTLSAISNLSMIMRIIIRLCKSMPRVAYPVCDWRGARFGNGRFFFSQCC
jgi:hypothetical protein